MIYTCMRWFLGETKHKLGIDAFNTLGKVGVICTKLYLVSCLRRFILVFVVLLMLTSIFEEAGDFTRLFAFTAKPSVML